MIQIHIYWCGAMSIMSWCVKKRRDQKCVYGILLFVKKKLCVYAKNVFRRIHEKLVLVSPSRDGIWAGG